MGWSPAVSPSRIAGKRIVAALTVLMISLTVEENAGRGVYGQLARSWLWL
jgi:hypothetical protein